MKAEEFTTMMDNAADMMRAAYHQMAATLEAATQPGVRQVLAVDLSRTDAVDLQMDVALLNAAPVVAAPAHGEFLALQENGHRFVLGSDGLYLEARRPWLHFIHRIGPVAGVAIPYGAVEPKVELGFGTMGKALPQLQEFAAHATAESPIEAAGTILWNSTNNTWRLAYPKVIGAATAGGIQFEQIEPGPDEHAVIDLHSHGSTAAFFSSTDDEDDAGSVKIAGVYGELDSRQPSLAFRICVLGVMIPLSVPADRVFA